MTQTGLIIKAHSGFFTVRTDAGETYTCNAAGRLTKSKHEEDALALGDRAIFEPITSEGFANGRIIGIETRARSLSRKDPIASVKDRDIRQVIVANVDLVVFVFACAAPEFHPRMLDRYLVGAEAQQLPVLIVASKVDLVGMDAAREMFGAYAQLGYEVVYVSVEALTPDPSPANRNSRGRGDGSPLSRSDGRGVGGEGLGLAELRTKLHNKLSVLTGKSGVGKSSLLNALKPGLALEVGRVSAAWKKGKHTTVVPELIPIDEHSWLADTPGIRSYAIWDVEAEELDAYYRELKPLVEQCAFNDCTHTHEKGCAVRAAVQDGQISQARYDSYVKLREELSKQKKW
jgi:ribosome biogenesis GTPase